MEINELREVVEARVRNQDYLAARRLVEEEVMSLSEKMEGLNQLRTFLAIKEALMMATMKSGRR